jgi:hypothetical protein
LSAGSATKTQSPPPIRIACATALLSPGFSDSGKTATLVSPSASQPSAHLSTLRTAAKVTAATAGERPSTRLCPLRPRPSPTRSPPRGGWPCLRRCRSCRSRERVRANKCCGCSTHRRDAMAQSSFSLRFRRSQTKCVASLLNSFLSSHPAERARAASLNFALAIESSTEIKKSGMRFAPRWDILPVVGAAGDT